MQFATRCIKNCGKKGLYGVSEIAAAHSHCGFGSPCIYILYLYIYQLIYEAP